MGMLKVLNGRFCSLFFGGVLLSLTLKVPMLFWLTLLFLLKFTRAVKPAVGFSVIVAVYSVLLYVALQDIIPVEGAPYLISIVIASFISAIAFMIDRVLYQRVPPILSSFIFPIAAIASLYISSLGDPFGTWGNPAYDQLSLLPLAQMASVVGIWGLCFMIYWFSSSILASFQYKNWRYIIPFTLLFIFSLAYGLIQLNAGAATKSKVAVAMVRPIENVSMRCPDDDINCFRQNSEKSQTEMFALTQQSLASGAKIVLWSEAAAWVLNEQAFIQRGADIATKSQAYIVLSMLGFNASEHGVYTNKLIAITPSGEVAWHYEKSIPVPGEPIKAGKGILPILDTPFGRISALICFDADFPNLVRQVSNNDVDLLLIAAKDWAAIAKPHENMAIMRGIENGVTIARSSSDGNSFISDPNGKVSAHLDYIASKKGILLNDVNVTSKRTPYTIIGDTIAIACVWLLVGIFIVVKLRKRFKRSQSSS